MKKSLSSFLVVLLILLNVAPASALNQPDRPARDNGIKKNLVEGETQYDRTDKVRILVELESEPAIEYANERGVLFKKLAESTKNRLHNGLLEEQQEVKEQIESEKVDIDYKEEFTTVVNGFSAEVEYGNIEKIEALDNVSKVYIVNEYQRPEVITPEMVYSKELVEAQDAWRDYGYEGEGMVIGIIDTGVDPEHRDMILSEETEVEFTEDYVNSTIEQYGLSGKYFTKKVPYGYNYMDKNETILDIGSGASMHGMHVAGTSAANGDEENGGILGIAPEAQVLALKVFGNDPEFASTYGDIYVKAIDDSINLGADVLNLSLGSVAGFVNADDPEQMAVKRATENGIMVAISGGNSAHLGYGYSNPLATNPDIGVSGSPGVSYESIQVSSLENNYLNLDAATVTINDEEEKFPFMSASSVHPTSIEAKTYELVDVGLGGVTDFEGKDVEGKFALIVRGTHTFVDKTLNAQNAGAAGVIIYNNTNGFISMATDASITIPQLSMLMSDGEIIKEALAEGKEVALSFNAGESTVAPNPEAGKMSSFTSWGLTPNLDFKPEITAPGGNIYSTLNDDQYGMMSGTSMAAPHVAGGSALVLQRVDEEFGLLNSDRVTLAKNILLNTSVPVIDKGTVNSAFEWNLPYSPRRQGAGLMQLHAALSTPVVVTEARTGEAKVALKEVGDTFSFNLVATNYSNEDVTYQVGANLQTDFSGWGELGYTLNELEAQEIVNASILINGEATSEVTVPAGESLDITVTADVSEATIAEPGITGNFNPTVPATEAFPNGYFVEGFVTLTDVSDTNPTLSVPYVGFKGDWNEAPIVDAFANSDESYYGFTGLLNKNLEYLGYNQFTDDLELDKIAISPNGDGVNDSAIPVFSLLRNAEIVEFNILDENEELLQKLRTEYELRKNYYNSGSASMYSLDSSREWNGLVSKEVVEGDYFYEIKPTIDYAGATAQSFKIPVKVDVTEPTITAALEENVLSFAAADNENGSGVAYIAVIVNGNEVDVLPADTTSYEFSVKPSANDKIAVKAVDYAGNEDTAFLYEDYLDVHLLSPEPLGVYDSKTVEVSGYVTNGNELESLEVAGKEIDVVLNEATKRYEFNTTVTFEEDGVHEFTITGKSISGQELSFNRTIIVDSSAPIVKVLGAPKNVGLSEKNPIVSVKVEDNFNELRVDVNGNEIFFKELTIPYEMKSLTETIEDVELPLKDGENVFEITAVDVAGNTTVETVTITKSNKPIEENNPSPVNPAPIYPTPNPEPTPDDKSFSDVSKDNRFYKEINYLINKAVISGYPDGTFKPDKSVTRAEAAIMIGRALGLDGTKKATKFKDVGSTNAASGFIQSAVAAGIIQGYPDGTFRPNEPVTRGQMAIFISRAFDLKESVEVTFTDVSSKAVAYPYIGKLISAGITNGYPNNTYRPDEAVTRAQYSAFLARALNPKEFVSNN